MILENQLTARLRFRRLEPSDTEPLLAFFADPIATEFLFIENEPEEFAITWIKRQIRHYESGTGGLYAIELQKTGELIGQCGLLRQMVDNVPKLEVGYHLIRRFWGKGYASEAAVFCRDFAFLNDMAETVISLIHPDNLRSQAVARRNGMTPWKDTIFKGHPATVWRIRREEWEQLRVG